MEPDSIIISLRAYLDFVESAMPDIARFIYRGQPTTYTTLEGRDNNTNLIPSLFRKPLRLPVDSYADTEMRLLADFKRESRPYLDDVPKSQIEWMALGQHHGLPSRLLDWTFSSLSALYFAVCDDSDKRDAHVYQAKVYENQIYANMDNTEIDYPLEVFRLYCPEHLDRRVEAQESCFTLHPMMRNDDPDWHDFFGERTPKELAARRCLIPNKSKSIIKIELSRLGITHRSLFPGLDGICKTISWRNTGDEEFLRAMIMRKQNRS